MNNTMPVESRPLPQEVPVYKVGAVIVRGLATDTPEVLVIQPKPKAKTPHDLPPQGLVRGTRQYLTQSAMGRPIYRDARNPETALAQADALEPVLRTLRREIHEEAGIKAHYLRRQPIYDLGVKTFASKSKKPYQIQWFAVVPDEVTQNNMPQLDLKDSMKTAWVTLDHLQDMVEQGMVSPGYLPVARDAVAVLQTGKLQPIDYNASMPLRGRSK